jgi:hypothetical protein
MRTLQAAYDRFSNEDDSEAMQRDHLSGGKLRLKKEYDDRRLKEGEKWMDEFQELSTTKDRKRENELFTKLRADLEKGSGGNKTLVRAAELEGAGLYHPSLTGGSMYSTVDTERAYRAKDPNSAEFKQRNIKEQNENKEEQYKRSQRVARNVAAKPWLFGKK